MQLFNDQNLIRWWDFVPIKVNKTSSIAHSYQASYDSRNITRILALHHHIHTWDCFKYMFVYTMAYLWWGTLHRILDQSKGGVDRAWTKWLIRRSDETICVLSILLKYTDE